MPPRDRPASWGSDHVGRPFPDYVTGDECLFCHRQIGPAWNGNRHQLTIRAAEADDPAMQALGRLSGGSGVARQVRYLLGSRRATRFLKRSAAYGRLDLLSAVYRPAAAGARRAGSWDGGAAPDELRWEAETFADRCAGCHTTAVEATSRAFAATSLDCFVCHGDVPLAHTEDEDRVLLSGTRREPRQVTAICGQCHLRGGKSKSTGLPYPNTFVAGDNLFRDFQVDFSDAAIGRLPPIDRHIYRNARDVAVFGRSAVTCLTCHDVHGQSSQRHQQLAETALCASCHQPQTGNAELLPALMPGPRSAAGSRVCAY